MGVSVRSAKAVKADRLAAVAKKKKDAKKAPKAAPAPKRAAAAAPVARARAPRVKGDERLVVCLGCINGALQTKSTGECFDVVGRGARCFACASGHSCKVAPAAAQAPFLVYRAALLNNAGEKELERLRAPVFAALKGQVVTGGAAGGATGFGGGDEEEEDEGGAAVEESDEENFGAPESPARVAGEQLAAAAGALFSPEPARGPAGVGGAPALTPEEEASAARIDELCGVIGSALAALAREVRGLPPRDD